MSMGLLVNTDTEPNAIRADAPHNNSSFEIENIQYQEPTIIQKVSKLYFIVSNGVCRVCNLLLYLAHINGKCICN